MKLQITLFLIFVFCISLFGQEENYPKRKFTIEPAIGLRLSSAFGLIDVQAAGLIQYRLNNRFCLASHTAFSFDVNNFKAFKNIDTKYSITTFQKFGIGTTIYAKHSSHTLFVLAGGKYFTYAATIENPKLEDNVNTKFSTFAFDKGLMYNLKIGRGDAYFSSRIYAPIFDGKWVFIENASLEMGAGFQIK